MARILKKQILEELLNLDELNLEPFYKAVRKITFNENRIIRFHESDEYKYYCTHCHNYHDDKVVKLKSKKICPNCGYKFNVIGQHNVIKSTDGYVSSLSINERNELIYRVFYFYHSFNKRSLVFNSCCYEVARLNVNRKLSIKKDTYYAMSHGWYHAPGSRPWKENKTTYSYYSYSNNFVNDVLCKTTITHNIKKLIKNTKYKYSALDIAIKYGVDILTYLVAYENNPKLELLLKFKCVKLLEDILHGRCAISYITHIDKKTFNVAKKFNLSYREIEKAKELSLTDVKLIEIAVIYNVTEIPKKQKTEKFLLYLNKQKRHYHFYRDYLSMAKFLGYPIYKNDIMYPSNLVKAHDEVMNKYDEVKSEILTKKISFYAKELMKFKFNNKQLLIRPATSQEELINESKKLDHCVKSYAKDMANKETSIFFIRNINQPTEPYVTLELQENKVIQVRAKSNAEPPKAVKKFVKNWEKQYQLTGY